VLPHPFYLVDFTMARFDDFSVWKTVGLLTIAAATKGGSDSAPLQRLWLSQTRINTDRTSHEGCSIPRFLEVLT
jgi:hypothetical protein